MTTRYAARRAGFTMVELLVVILIIAILAGLLLAALGPVRRSMKNTDAATEIGQIDTAYSTFKGKFNGATIPAFRPVTPNGSKFRLRKQYDLTDTSLAAEVNFLRSLFPQMSLTDNGLPAAQVNDQMTPNQMLLFFLAGVDQRGFSTNAAMPFTPSTGADNRIGPFLEVKANKIVGGHYVDPWGTPYAYFARDPSLNNYPHNRKSAAEPGVLISPFATWPDNTYVVEGTMIAPNGVQAFYTYTSDTTPVKFLNPSTYQIISAGADGVFGRGGRWVPGQGDYVSNGIGGDDLSNFNKGPMGQAQ